MEDNTQVVTIKITPSHKLIQKVDTNSRCWIGITSIKPTTPTTFIHPWGIPVTIAIHLISPRPAIISQWNHLAVQAIAIAHQRISLKVIKWQVAKCQHFITIPLQGVVDITREQLIYNFEGSHYRVDKLIKVETNYLIQDGDSIEVGCDTI